MVKKCPTKGERLMGKGGLKFKELRVWQNRKDLAVYVYQISQKETFKEIEKGGIEISRLIFIYR
ncbi:MAG: hypothetical protein WBD09_02340 [Halobacteriota archaeon]